MASTESRTDARSGWSTETDASEAPAESTMPESSEMPDGSTTNEPSVEGAIEQGVGEPAAVDEANTRDATTESEAPDEGTAEAEMSEAASTDAEAPQAGDPEVEATAETHDEAAAEAGEGNDTAEAADFPDSADDPEATLAATETSPLRSGSDGGRRPNTFLADLNRAMHTAAESARSTTVSHYQADAKAFIEQIHGSSATDVNEFRKQADDDIGGIRDWSKAEIARIREETEQRIVARKAQLEEDLEVHAGYIERQIERVQARVAGFEAQMSEFFEELLAVEDPTRFASMAQNLPEPPPFTGPDLDSEHGAPVMESHQVEAPAAETAENDEAMASAAALAARIGAVAEVDEADVESQDHEGSVETGHGDFATAEAEAAAAADEDGSGDGDEIPIIADEALAARLAGLVPMRSDSDGSSDGLAGTAEAKDAPSRTQLVVVGLVSVASIASFKRHLGRVEGVSHVGVASGPDGEFLFTVSHRDGVSLRDAIQSLPGFQARITTESEGVLNVSAHDPESDG